MAKPNVNGKALDLDVEGDTPLLWALREQAGLTGTKYGCGVAQCGSCTVHVPSLSEEPPAKSWGSSRPAR